MPRHGEAAALLAAAALFCSCQFAFGQATAPAVQPQAQSAGFIRVSNGRFVGDDCQEFHFHGWNGWSLLKRATNDPGFITAKFKAAQAANLNVMRFFLADDDTGPVLQTAPGMFDESVALTLDWLFAEAANYGIKLTPVFMNTWKKANGIPQFEQWCGTASSNAQPRPDIDPRSSLDINNRLQTPYDWLMSDTCRQQVKDYITAFVNRRNTVTGVLYKDDTNIFSWNLLNEPRCKYCGTEAVDSWYGEMAAHLKSVDPNHMVTTGAEGFFDVDTDAAFAASNPNDSTQWGDRSGQDFRANHAHPDIDYAVLHMWPDNWLKGNSDTAWGRQWIDAHTQVAAALGKPLVVEEFGKEATEGTISSVRDPWYEMVNSAVDDSQVNSGPLRAALFWQWDSEDRPRSKPDNSVFQRDSTFKQYIAPFAAKQAARAGDPPVAGCTPRTSAAPAAALSDAPVQSFSGAGRKLRVAEAEVGNRSNLPLQLRRESSAHTAYGVTHDAALR